MAEFDLDKMADRVAEKALDEFTYNGKTIREWVELMVTVESVVEVRMVEEFEKIKSDFVEQRKDFGLTKNDSDYDLGSFDSYNYAITTIDYRIAELKGENEWNRFMI